MHYAIASKWKLQLAFWGNNWCFHLCDISDNNNQTGQVQLHSLWDYIFAKVAKSWLRVQSKIQPRSCHELVQNLIQELVQESINLMKKAENDILDLHLGTKNITSVFGPTAKTYVNLTFNLKTQKLSPCQSIKQVIVNKKRFIGFNVLKNHSDKIDWNPQRSFLRLIRAKTASIRKQIEVMMDIDPSPNEGANPDAVAKLSNILAPMPR